MDSAVRLGTLIFLIAIYPNFDPGEDNEQQQGK